jgi:hypothetical protein
MASQVLTNIKCYLAGFDLSGKLNACALTYSAELQDATTFGNDTRINKGGIKAVRAEHQGYWDSDGADEPDDILFSRIGTQNVPMTISPETGAVGEIAFSFRSIASEYTPGAQIGEMYAFGVSADGSDGAPLVRGKVLKAAGSVTATGTGTAVQIGSTASGQTIYCALHVLSASGTAPTLDVAVQSDVDGAFLSPVTVATFSQQTAVGSDWQTAAGPNTDTYFRVSYTIGGTSPAFSFVVVVGVV